MFDIDETAIPAGALTVESPLLKESFSKLSAAVIAIAATGRSVEFALPITRQLELKHESIVANGALIIDSQSGEVKWHRLLSESQMEEVINICKPYAYQMWVAGDEMDSIRTAAEQEARSTAAAFLMDVSADDANEVQSRLLEIKDTYVYLAPAWSGRKNRFDVSIGHIGANKLNALLELYDRYSLDSSQMVGIGDGINDIQLFEAVSHKVAVANADPELIEIADEVVSSMKNDGLTEIVRRFHHL